MTPHRLPLVANRFEIALLILLSLIISTRLIWLQIEDRAPIVTDEFYASSLLFNRSIGQACPRGLDPEFPHSSQTGPYIPVSSGSTSPGLEAALWLSCTVERLSVDSFMDYAPILVGSTAFLAALAARLLTSSWVGGFIAASVVLSRGSIMQSTHVAGTAVLLQPLAGLLLTLLCLFTRTRDSRWLPPISAMAILCVATSPLFVLTAWLMFFMLMARTTRLKLAQLRTSEQIRTELMTIAVTLLVLPAFTFTLRQITPSATSGLALAVKSLFASPTGQSLPNTVAEFLSIGVLELKNQDLHWQSSFGLMVLAATWRRYLPRGSGFLALILFTLNAFALLIDGALNRVLSSQTPVVNWPLSYHLTGAVMVLEPMLIGAAAAYAWLALRSFLILVFPAYSRSALERAKLR